MDANAYKNNVGVFDSGVGGISVLHALAQELPSESFVFYGDSANAPYGEKTPNEVLELSRGITERLLRMGCKAIVIACNTATSAAAEQLRAQYSSIPIVGIEPALKPAALSERCHHGRVLVMATPMTVSLDKFQLLKQRWGREAEVVAVPCDGLAARIEQGNLDAPDMYELLESLVGEFAGNVDAVVLGCTHYPFVRRQIQSVVGDVPFFDGARGTARQLRRRLEECDLLAPASQEGSIQLLSSNDSEKELALYRRFLELADSDDLQRRGTPNAV